MAYRYSAFLSYSQAADGKLAPAIQRALHRVGRPWYRFRLIWVFRDKTSLSAAPSLWPAIETALGECEQFILLASPKAAASKWVRKEVEWWLENRSVKTLLLAVTDGRDCVWSAAERDFDWTQMDALPEVLKGKFEDEPNWVDFRWARSEESLSLRHSRFRENILDLAAPLLKRPRDEVDGDDVRIYRRNWRAAAAAILACLILAVSASVLAVQARQQRQVAVARQLAAEAVSLLPTGRETFETSALLALESIRHHPLPQGHEALLRSQGLLWRQQWSLAHQGTVAAVAFSPDGRLAATASDDSLARLIETATGRELWRLPHQGSVRSVAFSPDGKRVATGSADRYARVFDVATGWESVRLSHEGWVDSVAFSPDGKRVATGSSDGTARLLDAVTGQELARLVHRDPVYAVAFSPDGRRVATGSGELQGRLGQCRLMDGLTAKEIWRIEHEGQVRALDFSRDGRWLAAGGGSTLDGRGSLRLIDVRSGRQVERLPYSNEVDSVAFSPDGTRVAAGGSDRTVRVIDVATREEVWRLEQDNGVRSVAFSPDGKWVASASHDWTTRLMDAATGREVSRFYHGFGIGAYSVAFSPDGKWVLTGDSGKAAKLLAIPADREVLRFDHQVYQAAFSPDGRLVATGSSDQYARLNDVARGAEPVKVRHNDPVFAVAFSADGKRVATASGEMAGFGRGEVRVFDAATGKEILRRAQPGKASSVALSPDGRWVATGNGMNEGKQGELWILEVATGREVLRLAHRSWVSAVAFSPDGRWLATASDDGVRLVDPAMGRELARLGQADAGGLVFSPDSTLLAVAMDESDDVRVLEVPSGKEVARSIPHEGFARRLAFSPDSRWIATGTEGGMVRVIEAVTGKELVRYTLAGTVQHLSFATPSRLRAGIIPASGGLEVSSFVVDGDQLVRDTCSKLQRNLTRQEWLRYLPDESYRATCQEIR